ncbi:MFS transporter [Thermobifida cellulosilytica TB100]|uniref:MFS transporter n=1 Tax=Thermobifida cellulosilytica TB100 TaxID=665004 RepID=A0A147KFB3_THECS|nr:MFS transporter [Thermobifida cellulosilytica TB100]
MDDPAPTGSPASPDPPSSDWRRGYRDVLRLGEFRALWLAHALSITGNYLLNIAVTVLVFQRTDSALATGLTLALTFLPPLIAGPLLSGLADLLPRRRVMIASDLVRAALVGCIGIPGLPLEVIWLLLFCSVLPTIPFGAARAALLTQIAQGERFVAGSTLINVTSQAGSLVGLAAGGVLVALVDARPAVLGNGLTFLVSAAIVTLWVRPRPAPAASPESDRPTLWQITRDGPRLVFRDPRLRTLALLAWLAGCYIIPYGTATPMAAEIGGGPATAGLIMASPAIGAVLGGLPLTRLVPPRVRTRLLGLLAVVASLPLTVWILQPPLWAMVLLLVVSGMAASYQFVANATFVLCAPPVGRGVAFGLVAAGLQVAQGIGIALASFLVEYTSPHLVVTVGGVVGTVGAAALALPWSRLAAGAVEAMHGGPE